MWHLNHVTDGATGHFLRDAGIMRIVDRPLCPVDFVYAVSLCIASDRLCGACEVPLQSLIQPSVRERNSSPSSLAELQRHLLWKNCPQCDASLRICGERSQTYTWIFAAHFIASLVRSGKRIETVDMQECACVQHCVYACVWVGVSFCVMKTVSIADIVLCIGEFQHVKHSLFTQHPCFGRVHKSKMHF